MEPLHRRRQPGGPRRYDCIPIVRRHEGSCYHSHPRLQHPIMAMNSGHRHRTGAYDVPSPLEERTSGTHLWRSSSLRETWGGAIPERRCGREGPATLRTQPLSTQSRRELPENLFQPISGGYMQTRHSDRRYAYDVKCRDEEFHGAG
jgi:hypothetical protein